MALPIVIVVGLGRRWLRASPASWSIPSITAGRVESGMNPWDILTGISYSGFAAAVAAAGSFFWRFRLPFSLFLLAGAVAGLFYTAVAQFGGIGQVGSGAAMLVVGLATLATAIAFDMKDPTRSTRSSDHAFWLHMAAAPQIILGVRGLLLGSGFAPASTAEATMMLVVLLAFAHPVAGAQPPRPDRFGPRHLRHHALGAGQRVRRRRRQHADADGADHRRRDRPSRRRLAHGAARPAETLPAARRARPHLPAGTGLKPE